MNVFTVKGRNELSGCISGTMYLIEENGMNYYYLINILNPLDIHLLKSPSSSSRKCKQLNETEVPSELIQFHQHIRGLGNSSASSKELAKSFRQEQEKKEMDNLQGFWVHDLETTRYVIAQIGKTYANVVLDFKKSSNRGKTSIYLLDNKWKVKIFEPSTGGIDRNLTNIQDEQQEFAKKVINLIEQTGMPWNICKCFVNNFSEEEAIKVLQEIEKNREDYYTRIWYCSSSSYIWDLYHDTGVREVRFLSKKKQDYIYNYVCNRVD